MQLFLPVKDYINRNSFHVTFDYEAVHTSELFIRAERALLVEIDDVPEASKDYISPAKEYNYEQYLMQNDIYKYCKYMANKIHHYIRL